MKTIFKYKLDPLKIQDISMPQGANVLSAGLDPDGDLCVWAEVDSDNEKRERRLRIVGTGNLMPDGHQLMRFVGTIVQSPFVWHVFEEVA